MLAASPHPAVLSSPTELVFIAIPLPSSVVMQSWRLWLGLVLTSYSTRIVTPCLIFLACLRSEGAPPFFLLHHQGLSTGHSSLSLLPGGGLTQGCCLLEASKECHIQPVLSLSAPHLCTPEPKISDRADFKGRVKMQHYLGVGETLENHLLCLSLKLRVRNFLSCLFYVVAY